MKLYKNILSEVERRKLLKFCKTKLENLVRSLYTEALDVAS